MCLVIFVTIAIMIPTRLLRRARVLIVGCGDVGMRTIPLLTPRFKVLALVRREDARASVRASGAVPISGDLDAYPSLRRIAGLAHGAHGLFHFAPPPSHGASDARTKALIAALGTKRRGAAIVPERGSQRPMRCESQPRRLRKKPGKTSPGIGQISPPPIVDAGGAARRPLRRSDAKRRPALRIVYASTTGVYGDCSGALIDETRPVRPANARAVRRVSAEMQLRDAGRQGKFKTSILRIPGIYAASRLPDGRLRRGTPALRAEDDVFTSHIHADDLAAIAVRTLWRGRAQRLYHATDNSRLKMGAYFDLVASALCLPKAPRISRAAAEQEIEPMLLSFMRESRRLENRRLVEELRYVLQYPTVEAFFDALHAKPADVLASTSW